MGRFPTQLDNGNVPYRLALVEKELEAFEKRAETIADSVNKLTAAVSSLDLRIGQYDKHKAFWNKVAIGVLVAVLTPVLIFLMRQSWIVQMAKTQ